MGVTQNYIPAIENGTRNPGPELRQRLTQVLMASFDDVFEVTLIEGPGRESHLRRA